MAVHHPLRPCIMTAIWVSSAASSANLQINFAGNIRPNPPEENHFLLDCVCADGKGQEHLGWGTSTTMYIGAWNSLLQQEREEGKKVTASEQAFPTVGSDY